MASLSDSLIVVSLSSALIPEAEPSEVLTTAPTEFLAESFEAGDVSPEAPELMEGRGPFELRVLLESAEESSGDRAS